jgi:outer membrane protein assembly factor BamB
MEIENNKSDLIKLLNRIAIGVTVISAVFSLVVASFLVVHYFQMYRSDPLHNRELKQLHRKLRENPQDRVLCEGIRELDMISRGAFFATRNQLLTGRYLLLGGLILFFISGNIIILIRRKFPLPEKCPGINNPFVNAMIARRVVFIAICVIAVIIFWFGVNSDSDLNEDVLKEGKIATRATSSGQAGGGRTTNSTSSGQAKGIINIPSREELANNWPCFRGVDGNGITQRGKAPFSWDAASGKNIRWKIKVLKPGFSSPIVWGNRLFLSGGDAGSRRVMMYDAADGKLLWQREVCGIPGSPSKLPEVTEDTGYAAATMTTDGKQVYAIFANGDLICYNLKGDVCWGRNLGVPDNHYGHSSSLMIEKGILVVQYDHSKATSLIGIKPDTGKTIWKTTHGEDISWSSPIFVESNGKTLIISATSKLVSAHSLKDGKELWRVECMGGEVAPSPVYADGFVYVSNDNAVTVALDVATGKIRWQNEDLDMPDVASPIVKGKYLLLATSTALLVCVNTETGKLIWDKECDTGFYSSPILVGDKVYVTDLQGVTYIFKLADKYEEVGKCKLDDQVVTTPAFVGNRIYIRGNKYLYCIEKKEK